MSRIFMSHSSKDKSFARRLTNDLIRAGHLVWIDEGEIGLGESIIDRISDGLDRVDYVLVLISEHSIKSRWVKRELEIALHRELREDKVVVIPALLSSVKLPAFLRAKKYVDLRDENAYPRSFQELLATLGPAEEPATPPPAEIQALRQKVAILKQSVERHIRETDRIRRLLKIQRSPELDEAIRGESKRFPLYAPVNEAYAFELAGQPVTLGYLLHAIKKAEMKGRHPVEFLLEAEDKWEYVDLMLSAFKDHLQALEKPDQ